MIRTYLGEEPALANVETYSLAVEEDRRYVMDHFEELVIKSRSGWGGKDVLIAPQESSEDIERVPRDGGGEPGRVRGPGDDRLLNPRPLRDR